jgi:signal transduction histidine kinase
MDHPDNEFLFILMGSIFFAFLLLAFVLTITYAHQKRQWKSQEKFSQMKADYEQTLSEIKQEIQNETLSFIGKELHDNIGQLLSLIKLNINLNKPEKLEQTKELIALVIQEVRNLSKSLDLDWVEETSLDEFISNELGKIESTGFCKTCFISDHTFDRISNDRKLVLMRAVQECLNNIMKHSSPSEISITIKGESLTGKLEIQDNGKGFDPLEKTNGSGLINLKKRLEKVGGYVLIKSQKEKGAIITMELPYS